MDNLKMQQLFYQGNYILIESRSRLDNYQGFINEGEPCIMVLDTRKSNESRYRYQPIEKTTQFEIYREPIKDSLVKLVEFLWNHYELPRDGIIEYGSGATGYFYSVLKPEYVTNWLQVEVNPLAIKENRRRNPNASIVEGSYNKIDYVDVNMIAGLSSFDSTDNMAHSIGQVAQALKRNGYFLHIQDVGPSDHFTVRYLKQTGAENVLYFLSSSAALGALINGERVTTPNLFQEAIGNAITNHPNLELIANHYVTIAEELDKKIYEYYFLALPISIRNDNVKSDSIGMRHTTILATIAKKK